MQSHFHKFPVFADLGAPSCHWGALAGPVDGVTAEPLELGQEAALFCKSSLLAAKDVAVSWAVSCAGEAKAAGKFQGRTLQLGEVDGGSG
jgi:hypothetical protein